jgi:hypothetical protein
MFGCIRDALNWNKKSVFPLCFVDMKHERLYRCAISNCMYSKYFYNNTKVQCGTIQLLSLSLCRFRHVENILTFHVV